MVEEIMNYKAPIAILPKHTLIKARMCEAIRAQKRCRKEESIKMWQIKIDQIQQDLDAHYASKGSDV